MKTKNYVVLFFGLFLSACGNQVHFGIGSQSQLFNQGAGTYSNAIDILWVVDNSGSMAPLQTNMINNFPSIIKIFDAKGYDYRMAVTTTDAYLGDPTLAGYDPANFINNSLFKDGLGTNLTGIFIMTPQTPNISSVFATNASQGSNGSGDERAFSSFRAALKDTRNPTLLRPNAFLSIIILSDEDDFSGNTRPQGGGTDHDYTATTLDPVQTYINYLDNLTHSTSTFKRYNVNIIGVTDNSCLNQMVGQGNGSIVGQRYIQISHDTNGVIGSICDASFANSLSAIASQIATLSTQFYLDKIPQVNTIQVTVNKVVVPQDSLNGWTYNSVANSILFHGNAVPPQGATINVNYTPVSI